RPDAVFAGDVLADRDRCSPFGEACPELVILREAVAKPVEPFRNGLSVSKGERLGSRVDLDSWDDAFRAEELGKRCAVGGLLSDRLVEEDDAADELLHSLGRKEQLPVR